MGTRGESTYCKPQIFKEEQMMSIVILVSVSRAQSAQSNARPREIGDDPPGPNGGHGANLVSGSIL